VLMNTISLAFHKIFDEGSMPLEKLKMHVGDGALDQKPAMEEARASLRSSKSSIPAQGFTAIPPQLQAVGIILFRSGELVFSVPDLSLLFCAGRVVWGASEHGKGFSHGSSRGSLRCCSTNETRASAAWLYRCLSYG